jgi:hypothetical protein
MGWQVSGSFSMSPMVDRVSSRWDRSRAVNSCSCAASGSSPFQIRYATSSKLQFAHSSWTG